MPKRFLIRRRHKAHCPSDVWRAVQLDDTSPVHSGTTARNQRFGSSRWLRQPALDTRLISHATLIRVDTACLELPATRKAWFYCLCVVLKDGRCVHDLVALHAVRQIGSADGDRCMIILRHIFCGYNGNDKSPSSSLFRAIYAS